MKYLLSILLFSCSLSTLAQGIVPYIDFNYYFKSFEDGSIKPIQLQRIQNFKAGDNVVAFYDIRSNLMVYDGNELEQLAGVPVDYEVSDNLMVWYLTQTLNLWDKGEKMTLSFNCSDFEVKDSIVVFTDYRFKTLNVYYKGEIINLVTDIKDVPMADFIGENIVAFRDNGNVYKIFWQGQSYELDAWHNPIHFEGDTDILAFNDPITGTFAIFEDGEFKDLEDFHMGKYKCGNGFVVYENQNGDLFRYKKGTKEKITNFGASEWHVKDNAVLWVENGITYGMLGDEKIELARFAIESYKLKNSVIVFHDMLGGVSAFVEGKIVNLTAQRDAAFTIYGNSILVELFNRSYIVWQDGKDYRI